MRTIFIIAATALAAALFVLLTAPFNRDGGDGGVLDPNRASKEDTRKLGSEQQPDLARARPDMERAALAEPSASEPLSGLDVDKPLDGPEAWQVHYAGYSLGQIIDERRAIGQEIKAMSDSYFATAFELGEFVVAPTVQTHLGSGVELPEDDLSIIRIEIDTRLAISKTATLPQEGYEEAYKLKRKSNWLLDKEFEIRHAPVEQKDR